MPAQTVQDPLKDLELLIRSRYSLIYLETLEEERASYLLEHLADQLNIGFFSWSCTKGLRRILRNDAVPYDAVYGSTSPSTALQFLEKSPFPAIYHFEGLGEFLEDKIVSARLKDAAQQFSKTLGAVVITGAKMTLPEAVLPLSAVLKLASPGAEDYRDLARNIIRDISLRSTIKINIQEQDFDRLLSNLRGLTLMEAGKILTKTILEGGGLSKDGVRQVMKAKKTIVEREGLLEYYPVEENLTDVAGLAGLKKWLAKRKEIINAPEKAASFGLAFPRGIMLLGVQGCGKSLCAKAVAQEWGLPLLKLDPQQVHRRERAQFPASRRAGGADGAGRFMDRRDRKGLFPVGRFRRRRRFPTDFGNLPIVASGPQGECLRGGHCQRYLQAASGIYTQGPLR